MAHLDVCAADRAPQGRVSSDYRSEVCRSRRRLQAEWVLWSWRGGHSALYLAQGEPGDLLCRAASASSLHAESTLGLQW